MKIKIPGYVEQRTLFCDPHDGDNEVVKVKRKRPRILFDFIRDQRPLTSADHEARRMMKLMKRPEVMEQIMAQPALTADEQSRLPDRNEIIELVIRHLDEDVGQMIELDDRGIAGEPYALAAQVARRIGEWAEMLTDLIDAEVADRYIAAASADRWQVSE